MRHLKFKNHTYSVPMNPAGGQAPNAGTADPTVVNGIAQPINPMSNNVGNIFDLIQAKSTAASGNAGTEVPPATPTGFPAQAAQIPTQEPTVPPQGASPLANFFPQADNSSQQAPAAPAAPAATPPAAFKSILETANAEQLTALANRDYAGSLVTQEHLDSFQQGDFSQLGTILNAAIQSGVTTAMMGNARLANAGVKEYLTDFQTNALPQLLQNNQLSNMWKAPEFKDFNTPEMQPMVQMATNHVRGMFPQASPMEVQQKAMEMLQGYSQQMSNMQFGNQPPQAPELQQPQMTAMEQLFTQSN